MTPPRLTELQCPSCLRISWVIDSDYPGIDGVMLPYDQRRYACADCGHEGPNWKVGEQSPPEFLLQPHDLYPMTQEAFDYWVGILHQHFPKHPVLGRLGKEFVPRLPEEVAAMRAAHARAHPVEEMKDQDGARRAEPDLQTASEWVEIMKPGDTLVFSRRDGGTLCLSLGESGHSARCLDGSGGVLSEASGLTEQTVHGAVEHYLNGCTSGCVRSLRHAGQP
jgi:hypothetical protein